MCAELATRKLAPDINNSAVSQLLRDNRIMGETAAAARLTKHGEIIPPQQLMADVTPESAQGQQWPGCSGCSGLPTNLSLISNNCHSGPQLK